jgi:hypothetical protein
VSVQEKSDQLVLQVEEEAIMTNLASHDGGRLLDEQSPAIHHSRNFRLQRYMQRHMDTRNILGLEGRPLWSRLDYPLSNPIEKSSLEELI